MSPPRNLKKKVIKQVRARNCNSRSRRGVMGRNYSAQTLFSSSAKITTAASTERRGRVKTQQLNIRTVQCTQGEANSGLNPLTRTVLVGHAINAAPAQDGEYCDMRFGSQQRLNYEKNKRKGESRWLLKIENE